MRIALLALALGVGAVVYCCGPKAKPPVTVTPCAGGLPEVCQHDDLGDHDCVCPEE